MKYSDGSIIEVEKGKRYKVRLSLGYDPLTRRYRQITRTVRGTLTDARRARDKMVDEQRRGLRVDADKVTFYEYSARWFSDREALGGLAASTISKDRHNLKTLNDYLAAARLRDITPETVRRLLTLIKEDKTRERGAFSNTTLNMVYRLLKQILQAATDEHLIMENPCAVVRAPAMETAKRSGLKASEAARLSAFIAEERERLRGLYEGKEARQTARGNLFGRVAIYGLSDLGRVEAVALALATGMRRGEVFGLTWEHVDAVRGIIRVRAALGTDGKPKPPKSANGVRDIAIDAETARCLEAWRATVSRELAKVAKRVDGDTPVFCSDLGGYQDLRNFGRWFEGFRARAGFPALRFHELRHTQASLLIANGVDVKTVQTRLGHYSAALTLDWYAHASAENDRAAGDLIGSIMRPKPAPVVEIRTA